jgi:hypothetical protein
MAKKARRVRRLSATQTYEPKTQATSEGSLQPAGRSGRTVDFGEEYRYILADLQRISILAAAILAALVIVSLFIK